MEDPVELLKIIEQQKQKIGQLETAQLQQEKIIEQQKQQIVKLQKEQDNSENKIWKIPSGAKQTTHNTQYAIKFIYTLIHYYNQNLYFFEITEIL